ncbi:methyl-accepting chemotaxis protein [Ideonella sp. DXS22W]|uniref:Methyl-accepting chemotaxis protein n=1 Tax=Pseudaquabacterium inlustre TaxID=2984192 RepID=A0ABU9CFI7_9BURK
MPSSEQFVSNTLAAPSPVATRPWIQALRQPLLLGCVTLVPLLAFQYGGWPAAAAGWVLACWLAWRWNQAAQASREVRSADAGEVAADGEIARLALNVVPVWRRNLDAARAHSERSMSQLLESFAGVSSQLDQALAIADSAPSLELGAHEMLMAHHRPQIEQLAEVGSQAMATKTAMQQVLDGFSAELAEMASLTRDVQNIGRATHLLALNTSVEATRAGTSSGGFMAVAQEVRTLAGNSREAGSRLARHVAVMQERLSAMQLEARRTEADDVELRLRTEQAARGLVSALLNGLSEATSATRNLQAVGRQLQGELERVLVGMQSQDRLSQMIGSNTDDMARLAAHLHGARDPLAASPPDWLARLESTYTMDDQRSSHHGTTAIDQTSSVEFF